MKSKSLRIPPTTDQQKIAPPLAGADTLKEMYARMLRSRTICGNGGCSCLSPSRHHQMSEAVTVGVGIELKPADTLAADRRHLVQHFASTADSASSEWLKPLLAGQPPRLPASLPASGCAILTPNSEGQSQIAAGIGVAHAFHSLGQQHVCVILGGTPLSSLLSAHDAVELAVRQKLPVVFVFETTLEPAPDSQRPIVELRPESLGLPQIPVDGHDSVAVHRVATEALQRARQGDGPTVVDCQMANSPQSRELGLAADPIAHMQHYLRKHALWSEVWNKELELELDNLRQQLTVF